MCIRNIKNKYTFPVVVYYFHPISDVVYHLLLLTLAIFELIFRKKGLILVCDMIYFRTFSSKSLDFTNDI